MNLSAPHQSPANATLVADDQFLIFNLPTGKLHRLNSSAALVYELCDGCRSADDIAVLLSTVPSLDVQECRHWIDAATEDQLLIPAHEKLPEGIEPDAKRARYFSEQAELLRAEGQILASFVCQYQAATLDSSSPDFWLGLGELAHILGRRDDARKAYEQYLQLCPDNAEARHILGALSGQPVPGRAPDECIVQLYARFSEFYEDNMCGDLDYQAPVRMREQLERHLDQKQKLTVLELGCGTGLAGRIVRPFASHLTGVDLSPEMIAQCRQQDSLYDVLHVAEITSFLQQQIEAKVNFDLILACDTLIYFGDLAQVIAPASRLLKRGGWLFLTTEKGDKAPFKLTDSGRYSHAASHIQAAAADAGLKTVNLEEGFLRYEYGDPVTGWVAVFKKQAGAGVD